MFNWTVSAWPILASAALKSTLVLGAAWLITYLLRGRSAAARHTVWTAAAAALVALPLLTVALPALRVRIANAVLPADPGIVFSATASTPAGAESAVTSGQARANRTAATPAPAHSIGGRDALMLLWMAGIAAGFLQMLAASAMLWRTRRAARVSPDQAEADTLACEFGNRASGPGAGDAFGDAHDVRRVAAHGIAARRGTHVERRAPSRGAAARTGTRAARRCGDAPAGAHGAGTPLVEPAGMGCLARVPEGARTRYGRPGVRAPAPSPAITPATCWRSRAPCRRGRRAPRRVSRWRAARSWKVACWRFSTGARNAGIRASRQRSPP